MQRNQSTEQPLDTPKPRRLNNRHILTVILLVLWFSFLAALALNRTAIDDWLRLRGYTAPASVTDLASADTMTLAAQHLFYLNRPQINSKTAFTQNCSAQERTIVIGCYHANQDGIFLLSVDDPKLSGVEQVTAAHETLHAAYERLSPADNQRVNQQLLDYYHHGLTDQRVKDTITTYQRIEPNDVINEMHSIFGTEVANLPPDLEAYYARYFTNRAAVVAFAARYQGEFTSREQAVAAYDKQLADLKQRIDSAKAALSTRLTTINTMKQQMESEKSSGNIAAYNRDVPAYNALVDAYNAAIVTTRQLINQYNQLVEQRNTVALEEQQLVQEISGTVQSITQ